MKKTKLIVLLLLIWSHSITSQDTLWTSEDKSKLLQEYTRAQKEINEAVNNFTDLQWEFKPTPTSWSASQVIEHLNMWHVITQRDTRGAIWNGINMDDVKNLMQDDSTATHWIYEDNAHTSPDYTIPYGLIDGKTNLKIFNNKCAEIINEIRGLHINFRLYFRKIPNYNKNLVQLHKIHYGHIIRHLRQINRIKAHPSFPK